MNYYLPLALLLSFGAAAQTLPTQQVRNKFESGALRDGVPVGEWKYLDEHGRPELHINYDSGKILFSQPDSSLHLLRVGDEWQALQPSRAPRLLGSRQKYLVTVAKAFRYPVFALRMHTQGSVQLSFVVTQTGEVADVQIDENPGKELTEEVLRVLGQQADAWLPALHEGKGHDARLSVAVHFVLVDNSRYVLNRGIDLDDMGTTTVTYLPAPALRSHPGRFAEFTVTHTQ